MRKLAEERIKSLQKSAAGIRLDVAKLISKAGSSHIGSVFSAVEILVALYFEVLKHNPDEPGWPERDRFILSKGHACAGLYAVLAECGYFSHRRLDEFAVDGGSLAGHATHIGVPGVEVSTGALGHGLALAVGLAIGIGRRPATLSRVFALLSDGECDEGSTWEAALLAPRYGLRNLTAIVDYNKIQSYGRVDEVIPLEPFADKWAAFGWEVVEIDGHDFGELVPALRKGRNESDGKPICVIAHTVKGKGVSFMEDNLLWHYRSPKDDEYERALSELGGNK